jgi:hypothetical protein
MATSKTIFDQLSAIIEQNAKLVEDLPTEKVLIVKKTIENSMLTNLEIMRFLIENYTVPAEIQELYIEIENFVHRSLAFFNPLIANNYKGGRRRITSQKMRGGVRTPPRAGAGDSPTPGETTRRARNIADIAQAGVIYQDARRLAARQTRRAREEAAEDYARFAGWSLKKIAGIVAVAISGLWGANSATYVAESSSYYLGQMEHSTQVLLREFPIIGRTFEPLPAVKPAIPETLVPFLIDFNLQHDAISTPPSWKDPVNGSVLKEINWESVSTSASTEFTNKLQIVMRNPLITTEWPRIQKDIEEEGARQRLALSTCRRTKGEKPGGFTSYFGRVDPCVAEESALNLFKPRGAKTREIAGYLAPPAPEITSTAGRLPDTISAFINGIADVMEEKKYDTELVDKVRELVSVFNGPDGVGLKQGTGRFSSILLINPKDFENAKIHTRNALDKVIEGMPLDGDNKILLDDIINLLKSVSDILVTNYGKMANDDYKKIEMGDVFAERLDAILKQDVSGAEKLKRLFDTKHKRTEKEEEKEMYKRIIENINDADAAGIKFPHLDVKDFFHVARGYEEYYKKYLKGGYVVPLKSTKYFELLKTARSVGRRGDVVIIGAIGGCSVAILIGSLVYLAIQGAKAPFYVAAITSQFLENMYYDLLSKRELSTIKREIRSRIGNGELDPVTGGQMLSALEGGIPPVAPVLPALPAAQGLINGAPARRRRTRRFGGVRHKKYYYYKKR